MQHYYMVNIDNDDASLSPYKILRTSIDAWLNVIVEDENADIRLHNSMCPDDPIDEYTLADIQGACQYDNNLQWATVVLEDTTYHIIAVTDIE